MIAVRMVCIWKWVWHGACGSEIGIFILEGVKSNASSKVRGECYASTLTIVLSDCEGMKPSLEDAKPRAVFTGIVMTLLLFQHRHKMTPATR